MAENIASGIVERMQRLGVDGVDFMQAEGCGIRNMRCDDQTSTQLYLLELIRKKMPKGMYQYLLRFYIHFCTIHSDLKFSKIVQ